MPSEQKLPPPAAFSQGRELACEVLDLGRVSVMTEGLDGAPSEDPANRHPDDWPD